MIENGILRYRSGYALIPVHFPEGRVNCANCCWLRERPLRGMCQCALTDVYLDTKELRTRPDFCPVQLDDEETETENGERT